MKILATTVLITVVSGAHAGILGDRVWMDLNGDGVQDQGEPGFPDINVSIEGCNVDYYAETNTNANGLFEFNQLGNGRYRLTFSRPTGYQFSPYQAGDSILEVGAGTGALR